MPRKRLKKNVHRSMSRRLRGAKKSKKGSLTDRASQVVKKI